MWCCFYLFKVYMFDPEFIDMGSVWTFEIFPWSLLDVYGVVLGQRSVPLPSSLGENLLWGRHVANPLRYMEWLATRDGGMLLSF